MKKIYFVISVLLIGGFCMSQNKSYFDPKNHNPVIPGHFADPTLIADAGKFYLYATNVSKFMEPVVWISEDLNSWEVKSLGITGDHLFWAPSVIKGDNNKFYLYYSNGYDFKCHLYIGESVIGPWVYHGLVDQGFDLQIFKDPSTGKVYGTSSDPKSRPRLVELESNVKSNGYLTKVIKEKEIEGRFFDYSEGSFLFYKDGWYYMMYSGGRCETENYNVNCSRSKNIWGPYEDAPNNPILEKKAESQIFGPGHNSIFTVNNEYFIVYHRQDYYFYPTCGERQICIDKMEFDDSGWIKTIEPTNRGVDFSRILKSKAVKTENLAFGKKTTTNSILAKNNSEFAVDENYATYWKGDVPSFFSVDLGKEYSIGKVIPRFMNYDNYLLYKIEYATDNYNWKLYYDQTQQAKKTSTPITQTTVSARYIKLTFVRGEGKVALSELEVFKSN